MNASKEQAKVAKDNLWDAAEMVDMIGCPDDPLRDKIKRVLCQVENFVIAAERKLPTEAAFAKDRKRRKAVAK